MTHASLFSGIGGPEVAAAMMGWENAFHCEINPFGRAVLEYWFPESKSYEDVTKTDFTEWRGKIDILTAGIPCQPFSDAGKRGGREDERYLWPEAHRVINQVRPTWCVIENVAGITTMVEGRVLTPMGRDPVMFGEGDGLYRYELRQSFTIECICRDFEGLGYSVQPVLIPAAAVGAPHRRDRVFIIAHSNECGGSPQGANPTGDIPGADILSRKAGKGEGHAPVGADGLSPVQGAAQDTLGDGCRLGADDQQGGVRDIRDVGAGDDERVCGEERIFAPHSHGWRGGEIPTEIHAREPNGDEPFSAWSERNVADTISERLSASLQSRSNDSEKRNGAGRHAFLTSDDAWLKGTWFDNFPTVSAVYRGNDGIPFPVDCLTVPPIPKPPTYGKGDPKQYPFGKWRTETLKAYGNAIVPQVMYRIFQAIASVEE